MAVMQAARAGSAVSSSRALVADNVSAADGSYLFENLKPGTYTVYAASTYSSERAVCTNVVVREAETTVAQTLKLTATGSISGSVTLDSSLTGNTGFLVFVAGTSYMAMTDDAGNYTISGVPAGEGYQVVATKNGVIHNLSSGVKVEANGSASITSNNFTSSELDSTIEGEKGDDGKSIVWLGSFTSSDEINNPAYLNAFFNTTDGCSYIYVDEEWTLLARSGVNGEDGSNGKSIVWKGELSAAPANPQTNWAYFNISDGCSYIWNGTKWDNFSEKGAAGTTGTAGADGVSIVWKGELFQAPSNPELNWAYYNTIYCNSYIYDGTKWNLLAKGNDDSCSGAIVNGTTLTGWNNPEGAISIPKGVTGISSNAFKNCTGLTSVTIPDSVKTIGDRAFYGCTGLTSITIPDSVTRIGSYAFYGCSELTNVTIPDSVTTIGSSAFYGCSGLSSVNFKGTINQWLNISFGSYSANPLFNAHHLYIDGTELTDLVIPDNTNSIKNYTFCGCSGLTSITIPDSVTTIGSSAFRYCSGLTSVTIPDSVTTIGSSAFENCSGLTSITIPDSITSIGNYAFSGCRGLTSVTIPDSVTSIGSYAFNECSRLTSITIGNGVASIESYAFFFCSGLSTVNYRGSEGQWAAISIGSDNSCLTGATRNYNYTGE